MAKTEDKDREIISINIILKHKILHLCLKDKSRVLLAFKKEYKYQKIDKLLVKINTNRVQKKDHKRQIHPQTP